MASGDASGLIPHRISCLHHLSTPGIPWRVSPTCSVGFDIPYPLIQSQATPNGHQPGAAEPALTAGSFFALAVVAVPGGSDLRFRPRCPSFFFPLPALLAIGFRVAWGCSKAALASQVVVTVLAGRMVMSVLVPIYCFFVLRQGLDPLQCRGDRRHLRIDRASPSSRGELSRCHGTPQRRLNGAALALMESPRSIGWPAAGETLRRRDQRSKAVGLGKASGREEIHWRSPGLHEAFLNSSVLPAGRKPAESACWWPPSAPGGSRKNGSLHRNLFYGAEFSFCSNMGLWPPSAGKICSPGRRLLNWHFDAADPLVNAVRRACVFPCCSPCRRGTRWLSHGALRQRLLTSPFSAMPPDRAGGQPEPPTSQRPLGVTCPFNIIVGIPLYMALNPNR